MLQKVNTNAAITDNRTHVESPTGIDYVTYNVSTPKGMASKVPSITQDEEDEDGMIEETSIPVGRSQRVRNNKMEMQVPNMISQEALYVVCGNAMMDNAPYFVPDCLKDYLLKFWTGVQREGRGGILQLCCSSNNKQNNHKIPQVN